MVKQVTWVNGQKSIVDIETNESSVVKARPAKPHNINEITMIIRKIVKQLNPTMNEQEIDDYIRSAIRNTKE